jgi:hypothetical protein
VNDRPTLTPRHQEALIGSAILPDVAAERPYTSVTADDPRLASFPDYQRADGILIAVRPPDDTNGRYQLRRDVDRIRPDGKPAKYEQKQGDAHRLDMHPRAQRWKDNPGVTLWITEGIKKGDTLVSLGRCAVALGGVWCFRKECIPDWDLIALRGRVVVIVFDSDAETNSNVAMARDALAAFLTERGARVRIVRLPHGADGKKIGIDDYIAAGGELVELLAKHCEDWIPPTENGVCPRGDCREVRRQNAEMKELAELEAKFLLDSKVRPNRRVPYLLWVRRYWSDATRGRLNPVTRAYDLSVIDEQGWDKVSLKWWSQEVGISADTLSKSAKELKEHGILQTVHDYEEGRDGIRIPRLYVKPTAPSLLETVRALTTVVQAPSGWGGKRVHRCPDHPEAKVAVQHVCGACGRVLGDADLVDVAPVATGAQDAAPSGELPSSPPSVLQGPQLAAPSPVPPARKGLEWESGWSAQLGLGQEESPSPPTDAERLKNGDVFAHPVTGERVRWANGKTTAAPLLSGTGRQDAAPHEGDDGQDSERAVAKAWGPIALDAARQLGYPALLDDKGRLLVREGEWHWRMACGAVSPALPTIAARICNVLRHAEERDPF